MVVPSAWSILALLSRATYRETPEAAAAHNSKMPELPQSFNQSTESLVFGFYKAHFELRLKLHLETTSATEDTDVLKLTDDELATVRALVDSPAFAPYSIDRLPAELRPVAMALIAYGQAHFRFKPRRLTQHTKFALEQARRAHTWHQEQQQPNNDETQTLETIVEVFFKNVSDSLFVDGIQWNFILTFLLFGAEFALQAVATKALTAAENVARWQTSYFNQQLGDWIVDNDGWDGFIVAQQVNAAGEGGGGGGGGAVENGNANHQQQDEDNATADANNGRNINWLEMGAGAAAGLGLLGLYLANR